MPTPVPTPLPTPTPTPLPNDITLVGADPPQGSTVSVTSRSSASLRLLLNVAAPSGLYLRVFLVQQPPAPGTACEVYTVRGPIGPGAGIPDTETLDLGALASRCTLPQPLTLDLLLDDGRDTLVIKEIRSFYTLVQ